MRITKRIRLEVLERMSLDLVESSGQEVLWIGHMDKTQMIDSINAVAMGNESAVPALFPYMEKGDLIIHNHPSGILRPSEADINVASKLGNQGIGFAIVDNDLSQIYIVAEPLAQEEILPIDREDIEAFFTIGGALSKQVSQYEPRESQIELSKRITDTFNNDGIFAGEAGTGVGKSFAYLLPAVLWAQKNKQRIVISTGTINLQQQLLDKDIPILQKILGDIKVVLVKGRRNYLCPYRLQEYSQELKEELFQEEDDTIEYLKEWAKTTKTGTISDLSFLPSDDIWSRINSDPDTCIGMKCSQREGCFVARAKKEAASAQILIVNHHLLFSDLSLRVSGAGFENTAVLPPFERIIIDEAHNIEGAATSYFSESFTRYTIQKHINRIYRLKRNKSFGLLIDLQKKNADPEIAKLILDDRIGIDEILNDLDTNLGNNLKENQLYLSPQVERHELLGFLNDLSELRSRIMSFVNHGLQFFESLPEEGQEDAKAQEFRNLLRRLESVASLAGQFGEYQEKQQSVFWMERKMNSKSEPFYRFVKSPLEVGYLMKEALLEPFDSVVFTSATLSIRNSFTYWQSRIGLLGLPDSAVCEQYPSPFDYKNRVLLGIPTDSPGPDQEEFELYVSRFCLKSLRISEGSGLILFTSYRLLIQVYDRLRPYLEDEGIPVYRQGEDDRSRLLENFKRETKSVLFATDSFWEGVDVPGESLKLVIITKLPFRVPSEPITKARIQAIEARGGNAFMELSLPEAVMKFKQGFGRLMRQTSDFGSVMILDNRIITKKYGPLFLGSLPETQQQIIPTKLLMDKLEDFLYS
ncbi:helicase C-terminal domain-containing protein [Spirochaeta cellobiosiphila]|uniref:helicase C-terminal domain-containing protein n=1 Tax=Spirochaeta cellobiosiphila TaxID=504483 RepID=UPI000429AD3F|nr:helicase C-terminal domain-containing protein [Spirochaeta cellobiosiphila]